MKKILYSLFTLSLVCVCLSCTDERKVDVTSKVYMPQANYGVTYVVPNNGNDLQNNKNYEIADNKVKVYLGVYCSGLDALKGYSVDIVTGNTAMEGTTLLPTSAYTLPLNVTVENGKRENYFNLEIDLDFLKNNRTTVFYLPVSITNVTNYVFNDNLTTTKVLIKTSELLIKENIE